MAHRNKRQRAVSRKLDWASARVLRVFDCHQVLVLFCQWPHLRRVDRALAVAVGIKCNCLDCDLINSRLIAHLSRIYMLDNLYLDNLFLNLFFSCHGYNKII